MNDLLTQPAAKLARFENFKRSLDGRTRYLLQRSECVVTPSALEIYPATPKIKSELMDRYHRVHNRAARHLNVERTLIIRRGLPPICFCE